MTDHSKLNIKDAILKKSSKIFVAGGTGLVGSAIIKNLLEKDYTNIVANYHSKIPNQNNSKSNIQNSTLSTNSVKYVKLNLLDEAATESFYKSESPEFVFLAAARVGGIVAKIAGIKMCESYNLQYGTNFISVMPTNLYGPNDNFDLEKSHVLPALIRKIHLGKALERNDWESVRADLNKLPIEGIDGSASEEEILSILDKYGIKSFKIQNSKFKIDPASVRIEIWGTGTPRREFLWSEEMADACVFLMEKVDFEDIVEAENDHSKIINEIRNTHINIGTGSDISIQELAESIKKIVGFKGELYFNAKMPDGTPVKLTDPSKLHALGWRHKMELEDGIRALYQWYLEN